MWCSEQRENDKLINYPLKKNKDFSVVNNQTESKYSLVIITSKYDKTGCLLRLLVIWETKY